MSWMNRKKRKFSVFAMLFFVFGLVLYLAGLLLLFSSSLNKISFAKVLFSNIDLTSSMLQSMKFCGGILFLVGFIIFMIAIVLLYKTDDIHENTRNLIIEGKADVITLIIMTYVMIFMVVICLLYNEIIGALLFGITIIIQSVLNSILIKYYSKTYMKKK